MDLYQVYASYALRPKVAMSLGVMFYIDII